MPIAAWFHSQDSMIVGCSNGQLFDFDCKAKDSLFKKDDHRSFRGKPLQQLMSIILIY